MRLPTPSTEDQDTPQRPQLSPPATLSIATHLKQHNRHAVESEPHSYDYDISSLAFAITPFPCIAGAQAYTIEAPGGPRHSSTTSKEHSGLLGAQDRAVNQAQYGTLLGPGDSESLLDPEGGIEEEATTARLEAGLLFKYSVPCVGTYFLQYAFTLTTIFVVGHIGTHELGAVSLATMTANSTGLAVYEGLATALDTLCAQAYGSGQKELVGLHLQRMVMFMLAATVPIGAVWLCSRWILVALVPEAEVAHLAGWYLSLLLAGAPGYAIFEAGKRFMQAQGLFDASLFVLLIATLINIVLNYVFVFVFQWGLLGAAAATVMSNNLLPLLLWIQVWFVNPQSLQCWPGFSKAAFSNWGPMARLAVPGIIMVETEWLAFDILTFATSYLSPNYLGAQSIAMLLAIAVYRVPFSVGVAVSTRLGNLIGAGSIKAARIATRTYVRIFLIMGLVNFIFLTALRNVLPRAFTSNPEVVSIMATALPLLAAFQLAGSTTALANAILTGLGKQNVGGWCNLLGYYVVAVPLALFLCFRKDFKLVGLWTGCVVGSSCISIGEGLYSKRVKWDRAVEDAKERLRWG